jgi:glucose-6-phosphate 1-dehydrogenase
MARTPGYSHHMTSTADATEQPNNDTPTIFVLFGATGDLAKRMVIPAFYTLALEGLLPRRWALIGNGRGDISDDDFRTHVHDALTEFGTRPAGDDWDDFSRKLSFAGKGFAVDDPGMLPAVVETVRSSVGSDAQLIHYIALPPSTFSEYTKALAVHGLVGGARVVYEKPFGISLADFRQLDSVVQDVLDESQVYRIDHFLGKEATQELHVLRFANGLFEGIWNRQHIRAVQIDVPEKLDVSDRVGFYDTTGALRDMIVTHLFQVAAEVAMEPPLSLSAEDLQDARETVIAAFRPLHPDETVLGQFDGYTDVEGVAEGSTTDTFVAARLWIDTDRWRDVPFLLRTGKQMSASAQQVSLLMRRPDVGLFCGAETQDNVLSFSLGGSGEIALSMSVKSPGTGLTLTESRVALRIDEVGSDEPLPPYSRLIHDVILGDRSLFTRPDGLESAWLTIEPIMQEAPSVLPYAVGSWGPDDAARLAEPDGWLLGQ